VEPVQGTCDVCNASTSWEEGTGYTADEFRELVAKGFEPDSSLTRQAAVFGISAEAATERWKNDLVANSTSGWLLCGSCAARAAGYSPKAVGADPSGFVLTEELTVHPSASATASSASSASSTVPVQPAAAPTTTGRSAFTDEEWQTLRFAPFWAFHLVARADGLADEKELEALYTQLREAATQKAPLAREVFVSIASEQQEVQSAYFADPRTVTDGLRDVVRVLDGKAGHDESVMFKGAVAWVAVDTANASGPAGDPLELSEAQAIGVVWEALGFDPDEFYRIAPAYGFPSALPTVGGIAPTAKPQPSTSSVRRLMPNTLPPPPDVSATAWRPRSEPARRQKLSKTVVGRGERGRVSGMVAIVFGLLVLLAGFVARSTSQAVGITDILVGAAMTVAGIWMRRGRRSGFVLFAFLGAMGFLWWAGFFTAYLTGLVRPDGDASVWDFLFTGLFGMIVTGIVLAYGVRSVRKG
jgi:hypothetical protein